MNGMEEAYKRKIGKRSQSRRDGKQTIIDLYTIWYVRYSFHTHFIYFFFLLQHMYTEIKYLCVHDTHAYVYVFVYIHSTYRIQTSTRFHEDIHLWTYLPIHLGISFYVFPCHRVWEYIFGLLCFISYTQVNIFLSC